MTNLAVSVRNFSFSYPGESQPVVGPLDWEIPAGEFQLLVGATGSGKTTLLRCLQPALAPVGMRQGSVELFGSAFDELNKAQSAGIVGYVAQNPDTQLVCDSVWHELAFGLENLGVPQDDMRVRVAEVAHYFGIASWFNASVENLSGGQKQLLALASVLVMRPRILLLDEPTAQLDPVAAKNFLHALFRVNRELGVTVVVATHSPEEMCEYATSAVALHNGVLQEVPLERFAAEPLNADAFPGVQTTAGKPAVSLDDGYVRYSRTSPWVLRGFDLRLQAGEIHALIGGNACGKTTLLNTAAAVLKPARGTLRNTLSTSQMLLPQNPKTLFVCDTVAEELREWQKGAGYTDEDIAAMLARFGLQTCENRHPYDLSGGQQQLLAFAKVLLTRPKLLLLDEPTKGLDARAKCLLARALKEQSDQGTTILMATHDLSFAALLAQRVTLVFDGQAAATCSSKGFFSNNMFYRPVKDAFAREWLNA